MPVLHQILAVDQGIEADTKGALDNVKHIMALAGSKQDPMTGLSRTHKSRDPERWPDQPAETHRVQVTMTDLLANAQAALIRMFDVKFTRAAGNAQASASIILDGETILADVPVDYLLFLQGQLSSLITNVIDHIPVRSQAEEWHDQSADSNLPRGVWASAPRETESTTMDKKVLEIAKPQVIDGQPFPGQYQPYDTNMVTGKKTVVQYSGQLSVQDVQDMRQRAVDMLVAVRYAREKANMLEVDDQKAGALILGHIFGGLAARS
jgi:hypothetical protein